MWQFIAGKLKTFQESDRNWVNEKMLWLGDQRRCCWADIMVVRTQASANQRPEWGHKWPIRGQDGGGGCSHRMRVTGTLIEIKNQQRMQSSHVEGKLDTRVN